MICLYKKTCVCMICLGVRVCDAHTVCVCIFCMWVCTCCMHVLMSGCEEGRIDVGTPSSIIFPQFFESGSLQDVTAHSVY